MPFRVSQLFVTIFPEQIASSTWLLQSPKKSADPNCQQHESFCGIQVRNIKVCSIQFRHYYADLSVVLAGWVLWVPSCNIKRMSSFSQNLKGCSLIGIMLKRLDNHLFKHHEGVTRGLTDHQPHIHVLENLPKPRLTYCLNVTEIIHSSLP